MSDNPHPDLSIDAYDAMTNPRCPQLGQVVSFEYCRRERQGAPCRKLVFCWGRRIDVPQFLRVHFGEEVIAQLAEPPADRRVSLIDLIERAKRAADPETKD